MFIGHFAAGLVTKKIAPSISLGTLFLATQFADLIWPILVILGIEKVSVDYSATQVTPFNFSHYPYSHSLGMGMVWAIALFIALKAFKRNTFESSIAGLMVLSHWVLDFLSHRPDMPLWINEGPKFGLGLWHSVPLTLLVEVSFFIVASVIYLKTTNSWKNKRVLSLLGFLLIVYALNLFGPKPPIDLTGSQIALPALALWLVVAWGYWADAAQGPPSASKS